MSISRPSTSSHLFKASPQQGVRRTLEGFLSELKKPENRREKTENLTRALIHIKLNAKGENKLRDGNDA